MRYVADTTKLVENRWCSSCLHAAGELPSGFAVVGRGSAQPASYSLSESKRVQESLRERGSFLKQMTPWKAACAFGAARSASGSGARVAGSGPELANESNNGCHWKVEDTGTTER